MSPSPSWRTWSESSSVDPPGDLSRRAEAAEEADPDLGAFLDFLERRINEHPERLRPITAELRDRMHRLAEGVTADLDEEIEGPVSL